MWPEEMRRNSNVAVPHVFHTIRLDIVYHTVPGVLYLERISNPVLGSDHKADLSRERSPPYMPPVVLEKRVLECQDRTDRPSWHLSPPKNRLENTHGPRKIGSRSNRPHLAAVPPMVECPGCV
ncbi:hypothetical protein J6590_016745 [Homalodisca vitripennis]|nr:hypothetical protein J6590_016745 [Homalodisca vitripennis]